MAHLKGPVCPALFMRALVPLRGRHERTRPYFASRSKDFRAGLAADLPVAFLAPLPAIALMQQLNQHQVRL